MANMTNQRDVARECGLSRTTVSYALNERLRSLLHPRTQQQVLVAAKRLGYRPHQQAQAMRKRRSGLIGIIQFNGLLQTHSERLLYASRAIHDSGYRVLVGAAQWVREGAVEACNVMLDARVEGLILGAPSEWFPSSELERIRSADIPMVVLSGYRFGGVPQVRADVRQGMFELTSHLLRLGYRRLTLLTEWGTSLRDENICWPSRERMNGFQEAVKIWPSRKVETEVVHQESDLEVSSPFEQRAGEVGMSKLLRRSKRPEVVLCANDSVAIGAMAACHDAGVRVPEEIAITGFDNDTVGQFLRPSLTTVSQPTEAMAKMAVEMLVKQILEKKISEDETLVRVPCQLMVRQSCGASFHAMPAKKNKEQIKL